MTRARRVALSWLVLCACRGKAQDRDPPVAPPPPPSPPASTTTLAVRITDHGREVGARVLLIDRDGEPVRMGNLDVLDARQGGAACRIAAGVVGSWDGLIVGSGRAEIPVGVDDCVPSPAIPYGSYEVVAWRGIEFERWTGRVDLTDGQGRVELVIALDRAWQPDGTLAADLHVHAQASLDSMVPNPQRVLAQAAAGVQVVGLSDHDVHGDLDDEIAALGLDGVIASIASTEMTADLMHLNLYPVVVDPTRPGNGAIDPAGLMVVDESVHAATEAERLFALARTVPGRPIVQLNHPRLRSSALYDLAEWDGEQWPPPFPIDFDVVEVLAGYSAFNVAGDRRLDQCVRDFYTIFDHGHLITPVGNSDTHDLNWVLDGTTRTYVYVDDARTRPFDEAAFIQAVRDRRVVATSGPWLDVRASVAVDAARVGPGQMLAANGRVWLDVTIGQARFVAVERIRITVGTRAGPRLQRTIDVPAGVRHHHWQGWVEVGTVDTWIGVTADGDTALPLEQTGSYQRDSWSRPGVTPFAIASPILVDANRDGRWRRGVAGRRR